MVKLDKEMSGLETGRKILEKAKSEYKERESESENLAMMEKTTEPLLKENPRRFVIFPIQYHDIWNFYKKAVASFWSVGEVCVCCLFPEALTCPLGQSF